MIDKKDLEKNLKEAKINTYASGGEEEVRLKDSGKKFEYKKGNFYYRDIYYGFSPFVGEEIVFYQQKPIWGMNYFGKVIARLTSAKKIYLFLREALKKVPEDKPFRGPDNFNNDDFEYTNSVEGGLDKFIGQEKIFYKKELVYILDYHGGLINK